MTTPNPTVVPAARPPQFFGISVHITALRPCLGLNQCCAQRSRSTVAASQKKPGDLWSLPNSKTHGGKKPKFVDPFSNADAASHCLAAACRDGDKCQSADFVYQSASNACANFHGKKIQHDGSPGFAFQG
jgi:hypothetical protein